jgi:CheY-like chemotaxis protein
MQQTILLADDSPTIRRLVTQTFADADFRIVEVNNGDAAIRSFEEVRPNVVLADIYMPGKNGYQVCAYVRSHSEMGRTPVVLLVGAFEAFDEDTAKQAGATASITKPFEPGALIELVKSILPSQADEQFDESHAAVPNEQVHAELQPVAATQSPVQPEADAPAAEPDDLFGLATIFKEPAPPPAAAAITEQDIDRIADRVIQRVSSQVIENIAWEIVPDITEKIVREELKRVK